MVFCSDSQKKQEDKLQMKRIKMSSNEELQGEHSEEKLLYVSLIKP